MELNGEKNIPLPRERVWAALMDPEILRAAIPGCQSVTDEGNGVYSLAVIAAIGPVKARFNGKLQQQDMKAPESYTMSFEGNGGIAGFARGTAEVELHVAPDFQTRLVYRTQADIGGRLAQIGSRLVDAAAAHMSNQFFECLVQVINAPKTALVQAVGPVSNDSAQVASVPTGSVVAVPVASGLGSVVTVQMPAWAWVFTVSVVALLSAYLSMH